VSVVEQFPYCDRDRASGGLHLMPDLPIVLRHQSRSLSGVGSVCCPIPWAFSLGSTGTPKRRKSFSVELWRMLMHAA
jgi:hypothetical protein